jgi:hypothetical protein
MADLARVKSASAQFVERKNLHLLTEPLVSSGTLLYVAPDQVEKITVLPRRERLVMSGDRLMIENSKEDYPRTLSLASYPEIAAFVEGVRGTLAGDLPALERYYTLQLDGDARSWRLQLTMRDPTLQKIVRSIEIRGSHEKINVIDTEEADGDRSELEVNEDIHDEH